MKYTLITGASGGIGEAIAFKIAERKENLVLVARSESKLKALATSIAEKFKVKVDFIAADLFNPATPEAIFKECEKRNYEIESLINNAGMGSGGTSLLKLTGGSWLVLFGL